MIDLISAASGIMAIIERVRNLAKDRQTDRRRPFERRAQEAKLLLQEISQLIEKFAESVDLILEYLENQAHDFKGYKYYADRYKGIANIFKLNRRLFELSNDMQVLENSISKRLEGAEVDLIKEIRDYCMQIIDIEKFFSVGLAKKTDFYKLPLNPIPEEKPIAQPVLGIEPNIDDTISYFNQLLLKLTESKKNVAIALQELSVPYSK